jgi:hypothetical protein
VTAEPDGDLLARALCARLVRDGARRPTAASTSGATRC